MSRTSQKALYESFYTRGKLDNKPMFKIGIVQSCNPAAHTVDVLIADRSESYDSVPILGLYGQLSGNDLTWLNNLRGSYVVLINILGVFHVLSTFPVSAFNRTQSEHFQNSESISGETITEEETLPYESGIFKDYNQNRPVDFICSDKILRTDDGVELGLLKGGLIRLKASPLAQFTLGKLKDFARLVARTYQFFSDFGQVQSTRQGDKTSLIIQGGASYKDESNPQDPKWTAEAYFGDYPGNPDSRIYLKATDVDKSEYANIALLNNGQVFSESSTETNITVGTALNQLVGTNDYKTVSNDLKHEIGNDSEILTLNNANYEATNNLDVTAGKDLSLFGANKVSVVGTNGLTLNSGSQLSIVAPDNIKMSSLLGIDIFTPSKIVLGTGPLNNLLVSGSGVFVTNNGITSSPMLLPKGVLAGSGPIINGFGASEPPIEGHSEFGVGAAASNELEGPALGSEGDLVISLSQLSPDKAIILAANNDTFIKLTSEGIILQGSHASFIKITPEMVEIAGMHEEDSGNGGDGNDGGF